MTMLAVALKFGNVTCEPNRVSAKSKPDYVDLTKEEVQAKMNKLFPANKTNKGYEVKIFDTYVTYVNRPVVWSSKSAMTHRCHATQRLNLTGACEIKPSDRGLRDFL